MFVGAVDVAGLHYEGLVQNFRAQGAVLAVDVDAAHPDGGDGPVAGGILGVVVGEDVDRDEPLARKVLRGYIVLQHPEEVDFVLAGYRIG